MVPRGPAAVPALQSEDGTAQVQVRLAEDTVWLTQKQMANCFRLPSPMSTRNSEHNARVNWTRFQLLSIT